MEMITVDCPKCKGSLHIDQEKKAIKFADSALKERLEAYHKTVEQR